MHKPHLIEGASFDISFGSENDAFDQSADLGSLMQHMLLPIVDEVFTKYSTTADPLRIDRLEIDLGTVPYDGFQDALKQRLRTQLDLIVRERLLSLKTTPTHGGDTTAMHQAECDALEYFLLHGHMPARTGLNPDRIFDQWLQRVLQHSRGRLVTFLRQSVQRHTVVSRLVRQCHDATLWTLAQQLASFNLPILSQFIDHLRAIMTHAHWVPNAAAEIRHVIWEHVITESLANQHRPLDQKTLVAHIVKYAAQRQGQPYRMTLTQFASTASRYETSIEPSLTLVNLLNQLIMEESKADISADTLRPTDDTVLSPEPRETAFGKPITPDETTGIHDNTQLRQRVEAAFKRGHPEELIAIWSELVRDHAGMLATLLRRYGVQTHLRQQLAQKFPETLLHTVVAILEPNDHPMIHAIMDTLTRWQTHGTTEHSTSTPRLWTGTLAYLFVERGPRFDPPAYLRCLLWHLATHEAEQYQAQLRSLITTTADALPDGLPSDLAVHLETLAIDIQPEEALTASAAQRATLVQAYSLYDILATALLDSRRPVGDVAAIIDTLAHDHPWQLLRFYRELQTGTLASSTLTTRFSREALYQLLVALLALTHQTTDETPSDLRQAIDRYAEHASDRQRYYGQILDSLIHNTVIDFEALIAENRATAPAHDDRNGHRITAEKIEPPHVALAEAPAATPGTSHIPLTPDEAEAIVVSTLTTTAPLSTKTSTQFHQAINLLLTHHPTRLRVLLREALLHRPAAIRLVEALPEPMLTALLALLRPAEYIPIQRAAESIMTASAAAQLLPPPGKVRHLTWQFIWHYLIEEGRVFDPRDFVARLTASLTAHTSARSVQDLRAGLSQQLALDSLPSTLGHHRALLSTLGEIASHPSFKTATSTESSDASVAAQEPKFTDTPATTMKTSEDNTQLRQRVEAAFKTGHPEELIAIWSELVRDHAGMLATLLRHYGVQTRLRQQLAQTFPETLLHTIVAILEPNDHPMIHTIMDALTRWQTHDTTERSASTPRLWTGTLAYLLGERGLRFDPPAYLRHVLWHLAAHETEQYQARLRSLITTTADALPGGLPADLAVHLETLAIDVAPDDTSITVQEPGFTDTPATTMETSENGARLRRQMETAFDAGRTEDLIAIWPELVRDHAEMLATLLRRYGVQTRVRQQLARTCLETMLHDIVRVLEPHDHPVIHAIISALPLGPSPDMTSFADHDTVIYRLWTGTLTYLIVERGPHFDPAAYLRCLLWHLSAHDPAQYQAWLRALITTTTNTLPCGLPADLAGHLDTLASEAEKEKHHLASTGQPAPLVQAYVLYDTLTRNLQDSGEQASTHVGDMAAIIDTLARDHPWQLLRFYRELQTGTLASSTLTTRFSREALYRLLVALLALTQQTTGETPSDLQQAIDRYAEHASDQQRYYGQILDALIHNTVIDFEALITENRAAAVPTTSVRPKDLVRETASGEVAKPSGTPPVASRTRLSPEEAETIVRTMLTTTTSLSAQAITQFQQAITTLLTHHSTRLRALLDTVLLHRTAATRLVEALPELMLTKLLTLLRPAEALPIQRLAESIMTASAAAQLVPHPDSVRRLTWQFMWRYLLEEGRAFESRDFVTRLTASLATQTPENSAHDFRARLSQQLALDSLPSTLDHHRALLSTLAEITDEERTLPLAQTSLPRSDHTNTLTQHEEDTTEDIYVVNAGQVIASPYLPRLFAMLNLTEDSAFMSSEAAERAVHLLQFMVNECTDSPEYQLVLNKILCGVRTGVPITREITITDQERDAINSLVQGMIQNWKAIGNTSIAGFRESFLQRNGRLRLEDNAWHLVVQPRAFDMLIDQIPWSFSVIKHHWMHHPIHVQWR